MTLNLGGKVLLTMFLTLASVLCQKLVFDYALGFNLKTFLLVTIYISLSYIFSMLVFSIRNWKIYMALRVAKNCEKLKIKEEEKLNEHIVKIVNETIAKNPKLARKKKLLQLNKKWFQ